MQLKDTLNLPRTEFPMRGNLAAREPARLAHWEKIGLYERIQKNRANADAFVLHDGPPFTNGDVHIGTALNKLLKDAILRHRSMRGHRTPYVPGWDCHGLPIEHKVARELRAAGKNLSPAELRAECAKFSASYIEKQRGQFQRLGVLGDWAREYKTMNPAYEADILRSFAQFVERGLVYRSKKPVYWSIPCETALAEAEIEYKDHVSPAVYVGFRVPPRESEKLLFKLGLPSDASLVVPIWTTTPWTLPANLAIALNPDEDYVILDFLSQGIRTLFVVAEKLNSNFFVKVLKDLGNQNRYTVHPLGKGRDLEGLQTQHPFIDRPSPIVLADYVTMDTGTGCVHTAPGHGLEDYQTGLKYGLDIYCPLDDQGRYVNDGKIPTELVGVTVLELKGKCPANDKVLEILEARGALLAKHDYRHQYPHCWRSKTPVVFRAMDQWFVALDKSFTDAADRPQPSLRALAGESIGGVQWVPAWGENRIRGAVESRPDWCISRQRAWGVPIPAFFDAQGGAHLDPAVIRALADKFAQSGSNLWFEQDAEQLLADIPAAKDWPRPLKKSGDTLDVWIDSGCSHAAVLRDESLGLHWPADLYLEGSDQHRGWFQSSLWTSLVTDAAPPYRAVLTHGFVVNENGRKLSKSDGKPQTADDYVKKFGADLIRLWVASENFQNDITLSEKIFEHVANSYRSLRNTLMYQLGNLADFDAARDAVGPEHFTPLEKWALYKLHLLTVEVTAAFDAYDFHVGVKAIDNFVSVTLSRQYHDILKDRLYTLAPAAPARRAAQTAIHHILTTLLRLLAPVLPFTTDEAWSHLVAKSEYGEDSVHLQDWPSSRSEWQTGEFAKTADEVDALLKFRERVNEKLEALRQSKQIGKSLDAVLAITGPDDAEPMPMLRRYAEELPELFIVSQVLLQSAPAGAAADIAALPATAAGLVRCPRSWRWVPALVEAEGFAEKVSPRDRDVLREKFVLTQS